ncbi:MAG: hypothetical protein SPI53_00325 [Erysipelotrichaceae bacterium]|nr:hypothetical protein [Erysipelotrichaceae bacterium]
MMKQIYAALEINDSEIRLIVGEFFNTRFNVIKEEITPFKGISNFEIVDRVKTIEAIKNTINNAAKMIGVNIERVLLVLPSVNFKRKNFKLNFETETGVVNYSDITKAYEKALRVKIDDGYTLVNVVCNKYTVNGISYRRIPVREIAKTISIDIDLLMIDQQIAFNYVSIVEEAGINIMDICVDTFAIAKEAALFEKTVDQNIILIKAENQTTTFGLIAKGKLMHSEVIYHGLSDLIDAVYVQHRLPVNQIAKLIKYNMVFDVEECSDNPIFVWNASDLRLSLSERQLVELVKNNFDKYIKKICETSAPILESGKTSIILSGEAAKMNALNEALARNTNCEVVTYTPETIGARDTSLSAVLGALYAFKDALVITNSKLCSLDLLEYEKLMNRQTIDADGESLTKKIKNLFNQRKKEG